MTATTVSSIAAIHNCAVWRNFPLFHVAVLVGVVVVVVDEVQVHYRILPFVFLEKNE